MKSLTLQFVAIIAIFLFLLLDSPNPVNACMGVAAIFLICFIADLIFNSKSR